MAEQAGAARPTALMTAGSWSCCPAPAAPHRAGKGSWASAGQGMFPNTWIWLSPSLLPSHKCPWGWCGRAAQPRNAGEGRAKAAAALLPSPLLPQGFVQERVRPPPCFAPRAGARTIRKPSPKCQGLFWSVLGPQQRQRPCSSFSHGAHPSKQWSGSSEEKFGHNPWIQWGNKTQWCCWPGNMTLAQDRTFYFGINRPQSEHCWGHPGAH